MLGKTKESDLQKQLRRAEENDWRYVIWSLAPRHGGNVGTRLDGADHDEALNDAAARGWRVATGFAGALVLERAPS